MRLMYDSNIPVAIPADAAMVAGYVDGFYAWSAADWGRFPHATQVRIAVEATTDEGQVGDCESGAMSPSQLVAWVRMRRAAGIDPTGYCSEANWPACRAAFASAGEIEPHWWIAAYPGIGPSVPVGAIAHQYADPSTSGGHYDLSAVADHWPGIDPISISTQRKESPMKDLIVDTVHGHAFGLLETGSISAVIQTAWLDICAIYGDKNPLSAQLNWWGRGAYHPLGTETITLQWNEPIVRQAPDGAALVTVDWTPTPTSSIVTASLVFLVK